MEIQPAGNLNSVRLNPDEVAWLDRPRLDFELSADTSSRIRAFILQMAGSELIAEAFGLNLAQLNLGPIPTLEIIMTNDELDLLCTAASNGHLYAQFRMANPGMSVAGAHEHLAKTTETTPVDPEAPNPTEQHGQPADKLDAQVTAGIMAAIGAYRSNRTVEE